MDVLFGNVKTKTKSTMDYYRSIKWYMYEKSKRKLKRIEKNWKISQFRRGYD